MQNYRVFQKRIRSYLSLGNFPSWRQGDCEIRIRPMRKRPSEKSLRWYHHVTDQHGHRFSSFAQYRGHYFICMHGTAEFLLDKNGAWIECRLVENEKNMIAQLLSFVIPFAITLSGAQVLHASAVRLKKGAVAFMGEQGMGKSTMAAAFCAQGFSIISDDAMPLQKLKKLFLAVPSFPEIRLGKPTTQFLLGNARADGLDRAFRKKRVRINDFFENKKLPLQTIYVLERTKSKKVRIESISPKDAWLFLLNNSYRIDPENRKRMQKEALLLLALANQLPLRRLIYPRDLSFLPRVISKILLDQNH